MEGRRMIGKLRNQRGQSIVELALLLPILLLLFIGIFEFGRVMNAYLVVNNASREGARNAALGGTTLQSVQHIEDAFSGFDTDRVAVAITPDDASRDRGETVFVTVSYDIDLVTPIISVLIGNPYHIEITTSMRME
jgi:Flp pilus assembly protein TadG